MRVSFVSAVFWLCCGGISVAAEPFSLPEDRQDYLTALQSRAEKLNLSADPQWRAFMHFHDRFGARESTIDSDDFFLAEKGKTDLRAELNADLRGFFTPVQNVKKIEGKPAAYNHPQCLFPARYAWLNERLGFDAGLMPVVDCADYKAFKKAVDAKNAAIIFTDAYMGNPASFFGHTLLRFDSAGDTPLLSHALNYGAITGSDGGPAFIVKGVFGGYSGIFSVYPYYDTVNLYNNMENRDIWEYRLNLSQKQLDTLIAHIWELGHNSARYYFFSENCSYMLLETLNAALPDSDLTEPFYRPLFSNYTIPVDTVRSVLKRKNILKEAVWRPSRQTRLRNAYTHLSDVEKKQLGKLLKAPRDVDGVVSSGLTQTQKANVLSTAYDYLQYSFVKGDVGLDEMRRDAIRLLTPISSFKNKADIPAPIVPRKRPDEGHLSGTAGVYAGRRGGKDFVDATIRPAYHTLLDETTGFIPFGEITYLGGTLRRYEQGNDLKLQKFAFVDITSLARRDALFKPFSFKINIGAENYRSPDKTKDGTVFYAQAGGGWTFGASGDAVVFAMTNLHGKAGGYLEHNSLAGVGIQAGFAADFGKIRLTGDAERIYYSNRAADLWRYQAAAGISLTRDWGLESSFLFEDSPHYSDVHEYRLGVVRHF